jgi:hypothetical protein
MFLKEKYLNYSTASGYILENLERISLDQDYIENLVFKLNHSLNSLKPELKNSSSPVKDRLEPSELCSKFSAETIVSILKAFLSTLASKKGIERNLLIRRGGSKRLFTLKKTSK